MLDVVGFAVAFVGFGGIGVVTRGAGVGEGFDAGGLVGGVDFVGGGIGDFVGVGMGDGVGLVGFDLAMGVTKGDDVGVGMGEASEAGGFRAEWGGFLGLEEEAGVELGMDVRGGDRSSGGGLVFAILELGRVEAGDSRVRFFTEDGGSPEVGERSKVGESSLETRGGVRVAVVEEEVEVMEAGGGGLEEAGGRSIRGFFRISEGSIGIIFFKFFVADARVLSFTNQ